MESTDALLALAALAQTTRLDAFRLLVSREPSGLAAGDLARALAVPQNTLSSHLAVMSRAGLVRAERRGRMMIYRADLARLGGLIVYLLDDCCDGRSEACAAVFSHFQPCCPTPDLTS